MKKEIFESEFRRFQVLEKKAYQLWVLSGGAKKIDFKDKVLLEKAKNKITAQIEDLLEIMSMSTVN
jgi:hypothetical protein